MIGLIEIMYSIYYENEENDEEDNTSIHIKIRATFYKMKGDGFLFVIGIYHKICL